MVGSIFLAGSDKAGHFIFSELNFLAAKGSKRKVSDLEGVIVSIGSRYVGGICTHLEL